MKANIDALLKGRRLTRKDLADWCRKSESWISKIMKEDHREFPLKYWDRMADFFGISAYQLLQPGISAYTERRAKQRRSGQDRRVSHTSPSAIATHRLTDRSLVSEVLRLDDADRDLLIETIAQLKRRRIAPPKREPPSTVET